MVLFSSDQCSDFIECIELESEGLLIIIYQGILPIVLISPYIRFTFVWLSAYLLPPVIFCLSVQLINATCYLLSPCPCVLLRFAHFQGFLFFSLLVYLDTSMSCVIYILYDSNSKQDLNIYIFLWNSLQWLYCSHQRFLPLFFHIYSMICIIYDRFRILICKSFLSSEFHFYYYYFNFATNIWLVMLIVPYKYHVQVTRLQCFGSQ